MKMIIVINDGLIINLCLLAVNKKVIFIISMLIRTNKMQKKASRQAEDAVRIYEFPADLYYTVDRSIIR